MMFNYIDLFAGCGGLTEGFEQVGVYNGLAHVEWDEIAAKTLANRLEKKWLVQSIDRKVLRFDIQRTEELINGWSDFKYGKSSGLLGCCDKSRKVDLLIGGPPCQAYSVAGRARDAQGMQNDYRNYLFESYVKVLQWCKPDVFIFENVVGILSAKPGGISIVDRIKKSFFDSGYVTLDNYKDAVFNLDEFGVPQKRSRIFIVGLRKSAFSSNVNPSIILKDFYRSIRVKHAVTEKISASKALDGLTKFFPKSQEDVKLRSPSHYPSESEFLNHLPRYHNQRDIETFRLLANDVEMRKGNYLTVKDIMRLYTERTGKSSPVHKYHVIRPNEPSNTIPAHLHKDGLRHIHWDPKQARSITVREAARLQSFDDDFEFLGSRCAQYKMIGNAVPPLFSKILASSLMEIFDKCI